MKIAVTMRFDVEKTVVLEVPDGTKDEDLNDAIAAAGELGMVGEHVKDWDFEDDEPHLARINKLDERGDQVDPPVWEDSEGD
jgi:hypothetical protein